MYQSCVPYTVGTSSKLFLLEFNTIYHLYVYNMFQDATTVNSSYQLLN